MARWGLVPWWSKEMPKVPDINVRAETVHALRMLKEAFASRRALIPATAVLDEWSFFSRNEWQFSLTGVSYLGTSAPNMMIENR